MSLYSQSSEANKVETLSTLSAVLANSTSLVYLEYWCFICMSQPCGKSITHLQGSYSTDNVNVISMTSKIQTATYEWCKICMDVNKNHVTK